MEKHDLLHEFPEYQSKIHELKLQDSHFKKLFEEYDEIEHEIRRLNSGVELASDAIIHAKKAKLLHIKDAIFAILASN
ncbi:YdcH family protein [Flavobacterium sp. 25HG05S-40]|uniref:YdcH family protein n=1 Tax=Flavobacterium sp. 25HG05S-40 TaxID=3458682 RepID=UPI004043FCDC